MRGLQAKVTIAAFGGAEKCCIKFFQGYRKGESYL